MGDMEPKKRRGRPSAYTDAFADMICEAIANGGALYQLAKQPGWPDSVTIYRWLDRHEDFRTKYARARERQADLRAEEIVVIADEATDPHKGRLQVDARKWQASKLSPKKYGDRIVQEHQGPDGGPIRTRTEIDLSRLSREQLVALRDIVSAGVDAPDAGRD